MDASQRNCKNSVALYFVQKAKSAKAHKYTDKTVQTSEQGSRPPPTSRKTPRLCIYFFYRRQSINNQPCVNQPQHLCACASKSKVWRSLGNFEIYKLQITNLLTGVNLSVRKSHGKSPMEMPKCRVNSNFRVHLLLLLIIGTWSQPMRGNFLSWLPARL